ncbi:MAG: hypothetical protein H8E66_30270 [Planctomycetes bacterium]|nr:hypothetical protein [Planctomycetota bacterium]
MNIEAFLKSIGVTDEVIQHLDKAQLAFQRPVVLWVGLVLLIPTAYFIYTRQRDNLSSLAQGFRVALTATRVIVLAILIAILAGPYLKIDHQITKRPIVAILFDESQSMNLPAGPFATNEELLAVAVSEGQELQEGDVAAEVKQSLAELSRSAVARSLVRHADDMLLKPLQKEHDIRYYHFSRQPSGFEFTSVDEDATQQEARGGGAATYLGDAIDHVLEEAAGQQVVAMLVLSDGQNTGGASPARAARAAAEVGTKIFAAPIGAIERLPDVSIVDVYTSGLVAIGDTVSVHVTLESHGFDGRPVTVELKDGDEVLTTQEVAARDAEHQHIELTFEAQRAGPRYLTVNVPPQAEEVEQLRANNTDSALVRISEEKIRVLLIDGLPRWDFRFVKNAIRRDNGLAGRSEEIPDVIVETEWRRLPSEQQGEALPQTLDEIAEYHTIILGDVSPDLLTAELVGMLSQAVRERGVGLIVEAGTQSMPHRFDSNFQELLPVRMRAGAAGVEAPVYEPYEIQVTADGLVHETMRLYDDPGRNNRVWSKMPPYYWCAAAEQPAPAATVLAWNPQLEGRFGKTPLIAYHYAGDGKVMFVGTDSTWAWRQNVGDRFFYKFWGQAIRFVARRDNSEGNKSFIEVRPVRAQPGEEAQIELMAFDAEGIPLTMPTRELALLLPGSRETLELTADKAREGRYTGSFTPGTPGVHRLAYQPPDGGAAVEATLQVLTAPEEFRHPNVNRPTLELLTSATGGEVLKLNELATIADKIEGKAELKSLHREATLWDNWLTLAVLICVYSLDVGIRRVMGLV